MDGLKYKLGDRVKLRKHSQYYGCNHQIPKETYATIIEINTYTWDDHIYGVKWAEDGEYEFASYREKDLVSTVKATRLSRKIYPKAKESECGEWLEI